MQERKPDGRRTERGFALILAILALMLLTFLGLTLATTTSTELQIATNYRWSQQALYNAEAGLEAARVVLSNMADTGNNWVALLPQRRVGPWSEGAAPGPIDAASGRDFERSACDTRAGIGFGRVLRDGTTRYEDVSTFGGLTLNGAFTVWIRRGLEMSANNQLQDSTTTSDVVIVSEGVAPFSGAGDAFTRSRQATRILETRFSLEVTTAGDPCRSLIGQEGGSPTGENFNPCALLNAGAGGSLANAFGGAGAGTLDSQVDGSGAVVR
jgi:hypothetical protein